MWRLNLKAGIVLMAFFCFQKVALSQITVTPSQAAAVLAGKLAGQGVSISNCTLTCPDQANGLFSAAGSNLGLDSGIVLTTGRAATLGSKYGVNGYSANLASNDNLAAGDPMLDPLAGQRTLDACSLEFDVIPLGDTIKFNYVFSSEEYINAVCGPYNDAFAFFISGPGISGTENMALVPGTSIPVTINTINNGVPGRTGVLSNCTSAGPGSPFTAYYTDNTGGVTLTHQGLTTVLQAIHGVTPCASYHLKLAIADAGDPLYDSGVFLEAGSLQTDNFRVSAVVPPVPQASAAFSIKGCLPGHFRVRRTKAGSQPQKIKFITGGDAISGVDYSPLADSVIIPANDTVGDVIVNGLATPVNGAKTLKLFILSPFNCSGADNILDSAALLIYDSLHISMVTPDTAICGNLPVHLNVNGSAMLRYSWLPQAGLDSADIQDPIATPPASTIYTVTATLPGTFCPAKKATVAFTIRLTPDVRLTKDTAVCFNANVQLSPVLADSNAYYSYKWAGPSGFSSTLAAPVADSVDSASAGIYSVAVTIDTNGCKDVSSMRLLINIPAVPGIASPIILCLGTAARPLVPAGDSLAWFDSTEVSSGSAAPAPSTGELAQYTYYVSRIAGGCESPKQAVNVEVKKCCDGNLFIPTGFTPNGDGLNEKFEVLEHYGYFIYSMDIFNRWGQQVYAGGKKSAWDGTFGGRPAEMGTYFYNIKFGCILGGSFELKGDVTLIR